MRHGFPRLAKPDRHAAHVDMNQFRQPPDHILAQAANVPREIERRFHAEELKGFYALDVSAVSSLNVGFSASFTTRSRTPTNSRMARGPASPSRGLASLRIRV